MRLFQYIKSCVFVLGTCCVIIICFRLFVLFKSEERTIFGDFAKALSRNRNQGTIPRNIIQTYGRNYTNNQTTESFKRINSDYKYLFYDDLQAEAFVRKSMPPQIIHAYESMPRAVLKADYFRYISVYVLGGMYADIDVQCLRPIHTWTDNYTNVGLIVGIEAEGSVEKLRIARPLQLCQWAFAGRPDHPILKRMIDNIEKQTKKILNTPITISVIMNWTGPGLWTDTVFDYIYEKHHIGRRNFSNLERGRLIGDVYILPITAFSPVAYNMGAKGVNHPDARIYHHFYGTWRGNLVEN